jgi:thiamine-monophosphate kinase
MKALNVKITQAYQAWVLKNRSSEKMDQDNFLKIIGGSIQRVGDSSEDSILNLVRKVFPADLLLREGLTVPAFDAAVLSRKLTGDYHELVVTTDVLVEGADFDFDWMSYADIGFKSVMVNLSDIASMGADPIGIVVAVGLLDNTSVMQVESFLEGMKQAAQIHSTLLLGGDLSESKVFSCCITALGKVPSGKALRRDGAKEGDALCVTGFPGEARAGLMIASRKFGNSTSEEKVFLNAFFRPTARIEIGRILSNSGLVRGCLDLSDGLARDSMRIADRNKLRVQIESEKIPAGDTLVKFWKSRGYDPYKEIAIGGEDFELLFCVDPKNFDSLKKTVEKETGTRVTQIGKLTKGSGACLIYPDKAEVEMNSWGFDHFEGKSGN